MNEKTNYCQTAGILDRMIHSLVHLLKHMVNLYFKRLIKDKWGETPFANCSTLGSSWNVVLGISGEWNHGRRFHVHLFFNTETKPAGRFHDFTARAHSVGESERERERVIGLSFSLLSLHVPHNVAYYKCFPIQTCILAWTY